MIGSDGISVADALALTRNNDNGYNNNDGAWGGSGAWWLIILILFFGIGGWGRGGYGNNGAGNDGYNVCCTPATAQGVTDAFNFNQLDNGLRSIERGICDGFYTMSNNINSVAMALQNCCCQTQQNILNSTYQTQLGMNQFGSQMQNGFCAVDKSILNSGYQTQAGFTALGNQIASSACDLARGQDAIKYEMSQFYNGLIVENDKNTDRIINYLTQNELERLRTERDDFRSQLSINAQTQNLVNQLMPVARPAYITCSPYAASLGLNNTYGCGCGTGCNTCA